MSKLRPSLRLYLVGVMTAGVIGLALAAQVSTVPDPSGLVAFAALFALASVAQLWPVHISPKYKVIVDDVATFAAALVFSPAPAMLLSGGSTFLALRFAPRASWYTRGFNSAVMALGAGAAATVYGALAIGDRGVSINPLAVVAAAVAKYLVETTLVDLAVALQLRRDPFAMWWSVHRRDVGQHAALYALGALAAVSASMYPWALVLFAVPTGTVLFTLRESARLRAQTRATILELAHLVEMRDPYTHGHSQRVADLAERLARRLGMQHTQIELVREAALLHDIGKIGTDDHVLQKQGPLDAQEFAEMKKHAAFGAQLLHSLPEFWEGSALVVCHHERYDGAGYPRGLKGDEIPLEAAIISAADAFDAMMSDRPYRKALPWEKVRSELLVGRGVHWNPRVVEALVEMIDEEREVRVSTAARVAHTTV